MIRGLNPWFYSCYVERASLNKKTGLYDFIVRMDADDGVSLGSLEEIGEALGGAGISVSSGSEITGCCEYCECRETYLEIDISGATVS
jgi:hypothetical protein